CFEDTGPGMADDVLERAFDPYFTTKPKGEASGMGLSIARGIVKGHGGAIEVRNRAEGGCLFQVLIPAYARVEEEAGQGSPAGAAANACVLLVDDEPGIITGVSEMLERLGYKVVRPQDLRETCGRLRPDHHGHDHAGIHGRGSHSGNPSDSSHGSRTPVYGIQ
ncbi:MAG: hypothetical protein JRJ83_05435, partial [Deltaproteobacteria bacterium]|nr:hypothetical protein [Deltaproteobacteria bacterium]